MTRSSTLVRTGALRPPTFSRWLCMRARTTPARASRARTKATIPSGRLRRRRPHHRHVHVRVHIGDGEGATTYVYAERRQEPRRHVTGAPPLRSPCRRGSASRHSAPAALRRVDDDRQGWRAGRERETWLQSYRMARTWRTCYILRDSRPAPRPVDPRRSESRVGCWRAADRATPSSSSCRPSGPVAMEHAGSLSDRAR